ncbi:MAG: hypothetical protein GY832_19835 [Chloroflexi bacterium]|nr:hypothetical protein [Chloroflexota bacterium]
MTKEYVHPEVVHVHPEVVHVHQELNQEITAIGGHYALLKEVRWPFRDRHILYLVGYGIFDTSCCGVSGVAYALVPGFMLDWKSETNKDGFAISRVEPIRDEVIQKEVQRLVKARETVQQVKFQ